MQSMFSTEAFYLQKSMMKISNHEFNSIITSWSLNITFWDLVTEKLYFGNISATQSTTRWSVGCWTPTCLLWLPAQIVINCRCPWSCFIMHRFQVRQGALYHHWNILPPPQSAHVWLLYKTACCLLVLQTINRRSCTIMEKASPG